MADLIADSLYASAAKMFGSNLPTWLSGDDASRLASYKLYEDIYFNRPETFKLVMRGTNENPIYVPSGKIIINTINRYTCRNWKIKADPRFGSAQARAQMEIIYDVLFKREGFEAAFNMNKLFGKIRGDAAWLITGNADKPEGSRIDVKAIDPGSVFWVEDDDGNIVGVDIVQQLVSNDGKLYIHRQRYLKSTSPEHPEYDGITTDGDISYQVDSFEVADWQDPTKAKPFAGGERSPVEIVSGINKLPVYTWKNFDVPEAVWGLSELSGLETLIAGVNQAVSDEDLALAIAGLGVYVTDGGPPVDDNNQETAWGLGPAEVVEVKDGKKFERISGVTTVDPSLNHVRYLQEMAFRTSGASDVAQGQVEVQMAESGIALQLRLGAILDEAKQKNLLIQTRTDNMLFDLRQWFDVYEGVDFGEFDPMSPGSATTMILDIGKPLPEDEDAWIKTLFQGYNAIPAIFSGSFVRAELRRMGRDIPDDATMMGQIVEEANTFTDATSSGDEGGSDEFGNRLAEEDA